MRQKKSIFAILLSVLCVLLAVYGMEREPHEFPEGKCSVCHATDSSGNILPHSMTLPVTVLCMECHDDIFSKGYMHPVDVIPQYAEIPLDMPVSGNGEITCNTCHDVHSSYLTPYGTKSGFLRRYERGKDFCKVCHKDLLRGKSKHTGEAHFESKYIQVSDSKTIDRMSKNCISCHDGSFASSATIRSGSWSHGKAFMKFDRGSHPIGVNYESARVRRARKTDLKPISMVDHRIRFFDGTVGCGSCHNPYSSMEKMLVMSNRGSRLCLACHEIDGG